MVSPTNILLVLNYLIFEKLCTLILDIYSFLKRKALNTNLIVDFISVVLISISYEHMIDQSSGSIKKK